MKSYRPQLLQYLIAILAFAAAFGLRSLLFQGWEVRLPYMIFFAAITISAWYGGLYPGLLTLGLSTAACIVFWIGTSRGLVAASPSEWAGLIAFMAVGFIIVYLCHALRRERLRTERYFKTLVENSPDVISRFDRSLTRTYINSAVERITGISRDGLIGRPLASGP